MQVCLVCFGTFCKNAVIYRDESASPDEREPMGIDAVTELKIRAPRIAIPARNQSDMSLTDVFKCKRRSVYVFKPPLPLPRRFLFFSRARGRWPGNDSSDKNKSGKITIVSGESGFETLSSVISELSISHNFSDHYETMRSSWRLQGCKEVGPFRDVVRGTGGRADAFGCQSTGTPQGRQNFLFLLRSTRKKA